VIPHDDLSGVAAVQHAQEGVHDVFEPVHHRLVQRQPAALQRGDRELVQLLLQVAVVADREALHAEALLHDGRVVDMRRGRVRVVVAADGADPDDASGLAQCAHRGGQLFAADIVHEHVDAVRCGLGEQIGDGAVVVVERRVVADLPRQVFDLGRRNALPTSRP
jgi:hypothetical protein